MEQRLGWQSLLRNGARPSIIHNWLLTVRRQSSPRAFTSQANISATPERRLLGNRSSRGNALAGQRLEQARRPATDTTFRTFTSQVAEAKPGVYHSIDERSPGNVVATITISNPKKLNIVNTPILDQFFQTCKTLANNDSLRAVVLTGGPTAPGKSPTFIGGADIKEMSMLSSSEDAKAFITKVHDGCQALRDIPVPVIARVNGFSLGAGLEIMAACDLRIATERSVFGMPEVKVGIPSVIEAALLPGLIGMGRTRRLLYLAENITAVEAERWGLVEKIVVDEEALDKAVGEWVDSIVGMGPKAIRSQKKLMLKWEDCTVEEGIQAGIEAYTSAYSDGGVEPSEFMGRFLGRRR